MTEEVVIQLLIHSECGIYTSTLSRAQRRSHPLSICIQLSTSNQIIAWRAYQQLMSAVTTAGEGEGLSTSPDFESSTLSFTGRFLLYPFQCSDRTIQSTDSVFRAVHKCPPKSKRIFCPVDGLTADER